jgi:hypothetical protein
MKDGSAAVSATAAIKSLNDLLLALLSEFVWLGERKI